MSIGRYTREELARIKNKRPCCSKAEIMALLHMRGSLTKSGEGLHLEVTTEHIGAARRLFSLLKEIFDLTPEVLFHYKSRLQKNKVFLLRVHDTKEVKTILDVLGVSLFSPAVNWQLLRRRCCKRAYVRGAFLANGSLCNPESSYHLEIYCPYRNYAQALKEILSSFDLPAGLFKRRKDYVVYFKGSEHIVEFLRLADAHGSLLKYEDVRIRKGMRSQVNRLVNCDTANLEKTVVAAQEQIKNIQLIDRYIGLENISPTLRRAAELRVLFPEASLRELGEMFNPPIGKSGINHRLRRLNTMAKEIQKKK